MATGHRLLSGLSQGRFGEPGESQMLGPEDPETGVSATEQMAAAM